MIVVVVSSVVFSASYSLLLFELGNDADAWLAPGSLTRASYAKGAALTAERFDPNARYSGDPLFDAEWNLVTCQMLVLGLSAAVERAEVERSMAKRNLEACVDWMTQSDALVFARFEWRVEGDEQLLNTGSAALGYVGVALGRYLEVFGRDESLAAVHARINDALSRSLARPLHQVETYPDVVFPADISTCIASLSLSGHSHEVPALVAKFRSFRDPETGLLWQQVDARTGKH